MNTLNKHRLADWSKAPEWATHHAVDKDGSGEWFGMELHSGFSVWYPVHKRTEFYTGYYDLTGIDWLETLESRPAPELPEGMTALVEELQTLRRRLSNKSELQSDPEIESPRQVNAQLREANMSWELKGHGHQIGDTGDYDGCYEITNGKISLLTRDDDDEALQPIVDALNDSGCKFYQDDWFEFENKMLKEENARLRQQLEFWASQSTLAEIPESKVKYSNKLP